MFKILEKIKNFFSSAIVYKTKKKKETQAKQEEPKPEEKPAEQK